MKNYLSLCIWGIGPGRPYDNAYIFRKVIKNKDTISLFFDDDEECIIFHPKNISNTISNLKIEKAQKILWRYYYYGKPKTKDTFCEIEYSMVDDHNVRVIERGTFESDNIINIDDSIAFDSFGDAVVCLGDLNVISL